MQGMLDPEEAATARRTNGGRVRATLLLQCVILGASALLVGGLFVVAGTAWSVGGLVLAIAAWWLGLEVGLLPALLEHLLVRRAARADGPVHSIWFVDLDADAGPARDLARFHDDTRDNPTVL